MKNNKSTKNDLIQRWLEVSHNMKGVDPTGDVELETDNVPVPDANNENDFSISSASGSDNSTRKMFPRSKALEYKKGLREMLADFVEVSATKYELSQTRKEALEDQIDTFMAKMELFLLKLCNAVSGEMKKKYVAIEFLKEDLEKLSFLEKLEYFVSTFEDYLKNNFNFDEQAHKDTFDLFIQIHDLAYDLNVSVIEVLKP